MTFICRSVREIFLLIRNVITQLTQLAVEDSRLFVNSIGQIKEGTKLSQVFDLETLEFLGVYFGRPGQKREWLKQTCHVSF